MRPSLLALMLAGCDWTNRPDAQFNSVQDPYGYDGTFTLQPPANAWGPYTAANPELPTVPPDDPADAGSATNALPSLPEIATLGSGDPSYQFAQDATSAGWDHHDVVLGHARAARLGLPAEGTCVGDVAYRGLEGFPTIQSAIDASAGSPTVLICDGTHTESLVVPGGAHIVLAPLSSGSTGVVLEAPDGEHVVEGLAGAWLATIDLTLTGGSARNGGAVMMHEDTVLVAVGSTYAGNEADYSGGAIHTLSSTLVVLVDNVFEANVSGYEGGAAALTADNIFVLDNSFTRNSADHTAGALTVGQNTISPSKGVMVLAHNRFTANHAKAIAALDLSSSWVPIQGFTVANLFEDHASTAFSTGSDGGFLHMFADVFRANSVAYGGGAMNVHGRTTLRHVVRIHGALFEGNTADYEGGAVNVSLEGAELQVEYTTFRNNEAPRGAALNWSAWKTGVGTFTEVTVDQNAGGPAFRFDAAGTPEPGEVQFVGGAFTRNSGGSAIAQDEFWHVTGTGVDFGTGADANANGDFAGCSGLGQGASFHTSARCR